VAVGHNPDGHVPGGRIHFLVIIHSLALFKEAQQQWEMVVASSLLRLISSDSLDKAGGKEYFEG